MSNSIFHIQIQSHAATYAKGTQQNLGQNQLVVANAASHAKGTDNDMTSDTKEAREKKRALEAQRAKEKAARDESKTQESQRGFLA